MLNVTDEQKMMFWDDRYSHNYVFRFPETTLSFDNEQLHSEEITVRESICDEEDLKLGGCIASSIEFVVSEIMAEEIAGLSFTAEIEVKDEDGLVVQVVPMGSFIVDAAEQMNDKDYKKVIAYDYMYEMSVDVSEWYNGFFADSVTHTVKETREALLEHLGASYIVQTLPNDDVLLEKTIEPNGNLTGTELLRSICEINGAFGRMNREGFFEEITLHGLGLYPEDALGEDGNLYPEETLYPEDAFEYLGQFDGSTICPQWRSTKYEEYMTQPITCLNIQSIAEDVGVTVGDDLSNPYVITSNMLLYGKSVGELQNIGSSILSQIKGLTYRPNTTELDGLPYLECGDVFALEKKNDSVESYIFSRTLKGIQALIDTFEAKGNKVRANEVTANEEIQQLKGKTLQIKKEIENFSVKLTDVEKNAETLLDMTASTIVLQVQKDGKVSAVALDGSGDEVSFTVSADNIVFEGNKIDLTARELAIVSDNFELTKEGIMKAQGGEFEGTLNGVTGSFEKLVLGELGESGIMIGEVGYDSPAFVIGSAIFALIDTLNSNTLKVSEVEELVEESGIKVLSVIEFQNGITVKGYANCENVLVKELYALKSKANTLVVGGYKLVTGSVVVDYTNATTISSRQYIDAPGISPEKPVYVCNGDFDAQPSLIVSNAGVLPSSEQITFTISGWSMSPARYSYSYWVKED